MGGAQHRDTVIDRVVVYRNGALIRRRGTAPPGPVVVNDLSLLFTADSLRIRPSAGEVTGLVDTCQVRCEARDRGALKATWKAARNSVTDLERRVTRLERCVRRAELLAPQDPGEPPLQKAPDAEALLAVHAAASADLVSLHADLRAASEAFEAARHAEAVARFAAEQSSDAPRFMRGVAFTLSGAGEAAIDFELDYFVPAARWVPAYRLEIERDGSSATLCLDGMVAQATGEDWTQAEVLLATADLSRATTLPELRSWRIGTEQGLARPAWRPLPPGLETLFAGYDALPPRTTTLADRASEVDHEETMEFEDSTPIPRAKRGRPASKPVRVEEIVIQRVTTPPGILPAMPAPSAPATGVARPRSVGLGYGGSADHGSADSVTAAIAPPDDGLPAQLRHSYLRMAGPDERDRGRLHPVVPLTHLWSLVEEQPGADLDALRLAVDAIEVARRRLWSLPAPAGTHRVADGFHQVYTTPGRHTVPGDGIWHRLGATSFTGPVRTEFRVVPREDPQVYRFVEIDGPDVELPSGPLEVWVGGQFRSRSRVDGTGGSGTIALNLGVEPALRVVDRVAHIQQSERGLMSQTTLVEHRVAVRIRSALSAPARVVVYDRLPCAPEGSKEIEVGLIGSIPPPEMTNKDPHGRSLEGGMHWPMMVEPGQVATLEYTYTVSFSSRYELTGGNRRE